MNAVWTSTWGAIDVFVEGATCEIPSREEVRAFAEAASHIQEHDGVFDDPKDLTGPLARRIML
jgi:hypothetical protein